MLLTQPVKAVIFDMDGTMIDSMPHHASTWMDFAQAHGVAMDIDDLMRRTTGRTGLECVRIVATLPLWQERANAQTTILPHPDAAARPQDAGCALLR